MRVESEHRDRTDRDAARFRVRRLTGAVVAGSVALAGAVAGYVATAASGHKTAQQTGTTRATTQVEVPTTPAAPQLDSSGSSSQSSVPAPSVTQSPPVAVSGGS